MIAASNNKGALLLSAGRHEEALQVFLATLEMIRSRVERQEDEKSSMSLPSTFKPSDACRVSIPSLNGSPHNSFELYSRALLISEETESEVLLSMVVLYNAAIAYHHQGLQFSGSMMRAMSMYKMTLSLCEEACKNATEGEELFIQVFLMAVMNNMGHIFSHFCQADEESACRSKLHALLYACPKARTVLPESDYLLFFLNASDVSSQHNAAPAA